MDTLATGAAFPPDLPALYEGLAAQFEMVPIASLQNTRARDGPRADSDGIRKYLPESYRSRVQLHPAAHRVRQDRRQLSLRDTQVACARPDLQAV